MQNPKILRRRIFYQDLYFYQKSDVIYQLTFVFTQRFLDKYKDRTVDQMVQAARSCKQNIVEGIEAGEASSETEIKLLNVARASLQELREDYEDYLKARNLTIWDKEHLRFKSMVEFCRAKNQWDEYEKYASNWNDEEIANISLSLCHIIDKMLSKYITTQTNIFEQQGGIRERMHAARTGYRQKQDEEMMALEAENKRLKEENARLKEELERLVKTSDD